MRGTKKARAPLIHLLAALLVLTLGSSLVAETAAASDASSVDTTSQLRTAARPEIEKQRQQAEQQASESLDQDAVAAIKLTRMAVAAIGANKKDDAMKANVEASRKISILLTRNPANALIPVEVESRSLTPPPTKAKTS
jgi:hypothetical protein